MQTAHHLQHRKHWSSAFVAQRLNIGCPSTIQNVLPGICIIDEGTRRAVLEYEADNLIDSRYISYASKREPFWLMLLDKIHTYKHTLAIPAPSLRTTSPHQRCKPIFSIPTTSLVCS